MFNPDKNELVPNTTQEANSTEMKISEINQNAGTITTNVCAKFDNK